MRLPNSVFVALRNHCRPNGLRVTGLESRLLLTLFRRILAVHQTPFTTAAGMLVTPFTLFGR